MGSSAQRQHERILDGIAAMNDAATLETASLAIFETARDIVDCDHGGYHEVNLLLNRSVAYFSSPDVGRQLAKDAAQWDRFLPSHPILSRFRTMPASGPLRLSDVTDVSAFHREGLGGQMFRTVSTRNQVVLNLGSDPSVPGGNDILPVMIGLPLNRSGSDFSDGDIAALTTLQRLARPILRRKRAEHLIALIDAAQFTSSLCGAMMGLGLTERQAEVAFWMLKGKSNTDIGTILDIGAQTVRHHSMAIYARLGTDGRLGLQRHVIWSILRSH